MSFRDAIRDAEYGIGYELQCCGGIVLQSTEEGCPIQVRAIEPTAVGIRLLALWEVSKMPFQWVKFKMCERRGHPNWVDTGYGGPDSGWDAGYCKDCGWGYHVTMY